MKKAILYVRVSTDEQADKGYSQRDQDERLRRYCEINNIEIIRTVFEDHSAKTFNRPEWKKLLTDLKRHRGKNTDVILFTKWDRFSRNAGDAYQMIAILKNLDIEAQAMEQPLDLEIPENKIMLAFYLAAPEVENDRRALNVKSGMRRAKKEGRCMGTAPFGYDNKTREDGSKYIAINPEEGPTMQYIFKSIHEGVFAPDQIRKKLNDQGIKISRANFYRQVRNPLYCAKIKIKAYKGEDEYLVDGQHEPLISEEMFYKVQDILTGRERTVQVAVKGNKALPLQGFLQCRMCNRGLTGSSSKSCTGNYYYYYHAQAQFGCGCRYRADMVHDGIEKLLKKFVPLPGMEELYKQVIADIYKMQRGNSSDERQGISAQIVKVQQKLTNARNLLVEDQIEAADFKIIKRECEDQLKRFELALTNLTIPKSNSMSIDRMLLTAIKALSRLKRMYLDGDVQTKRALLGCIFREKLLFDGKKYRTTRLNEVAALIFHITKNLRENENGKDAPPAQLSREVVPTRIELISKV
jgi:site-specific DNA recombinase